MMGKFLATPRHQGPVADRIVPPHDAHILIPRTCQFIALHGERDFADVITYFEMGKLY